MVIFPIKSCKITIKSTPKKEVGVIYTDLMVIENR